MAQTLFGFVVLIPKLTKVDMLKFLKNLWKSFTGGNGLSDILGSGARNWIKSQTGSGLTDADKEANAQSMQNAEDIYQRQVSGMQKAGLNPALMYQNGASGSAPEASVSQNAATMSDMMQLFLLPMQRKMMKAQIDNIGADSDKKRAETDTEKLRAENLGLINQYYPELTESTINKIASEIGVNLADINQKEVQTALTNIQTLIADKENKYAEAYFKARADYESAKTEESKASAARSAAEALMTGYEYTFAKENGYKLSSSGYLAIASAIGSWLNKDDKNEPQIIREVIKPVAKGEKTPQSLGRESGKRARQWLSRQWRGFKSQIVGNSWD